MNESKSKRIRHILFLSMLNVFPALTTDMYLPALPTLGAVFDASLGLVSLTMVLYLIAYSASMLIWGPLSDRYGRKPILLTAVTMYVLASVACSAAISIYQLILFRIFQGVGAGAAVAVSMAITKDLFEAKVREKALASIAMIMMIGPIIAPIIGAWLFTVTSWRGQFVALTLFGTVALIVVAFMRETNTIRTSSGIAGTLGRLVEVMKIRSFAYGVLLFAFIGSPLWIFIGLSSEIFVNGFGLTEQEYSFYFAANGVLSILSIGLYLILSKYISRFKIITSGFIAVAVSGLLTIAVGNLSPLVFLLTVVVSTVAGAQLRTPSMNLLLEQIERDSGSASSLISSTFTIIGSILLAIASMGWGNIIVVFGSVNLAVGIACSIFWRILVRRNILTDSLADKSNSQIQMKELSSVKTGGD